jgi:hypothetical protein
LWDVYSSIRLESFYGQKKIGRDGCLFGHCIYSGSCFKAMAGSQTADVRLVVFMTVVIAAAITVTILLTIKK